MKHRKLLTVAALAAFLTFVILGCNRKDHLSSDVLKDGSVNISWLKSEFTARSALSLLKVQLGNEISYNTNPEWEKVIVKEENGTRYFYVPLKNDDYATVSGVRKSLNVVNQKSYLIGYATDKNQKEKLSFFKGDYLMTSDKESGAKNRSVNSSASTESFSGLVAISDLNKRMVTYQYLPRPFVSKMSSSTIRRTVVEPVVGEKFELYYKTMADSLFEAWEIPLKVDMLLRLKENLPDFYFPYDYGQYLENLTPYQISELHYYLSFFDIPIDTYGGTLPIGSVIRCYKVCHWAKGEDAPGTPDGSGGITIGTTMVDVELECTSPAGGDWRLISSSISACRWENMDSDPSGPGPIVLPTGDGASGGSTPPGGGGGSTTPDPNEENDELNSPKKVDCESFDYSQTTTANWQEAGVKKIRLQWIWTDPTSNHGFFRRIWVPQVVFGLPMYYTMANGTTKTLSQADAAIRTAIIVDQAKTDTYLRFKEENAPEATVIDFFKKRVNEYMQTQKGTAGATGSGSPSIKFKDEERSNFFNPYGC